MKYNFVLTLILYLFIFFSSIKSEESNHPILDFDLNSVDDNILKSFEDFEFLKDKQDTLNIKQKMKKVACLNIITNVIKQSKSDIKHQLKTARKENKNNFNIFLNNMTNTCIEIIKEKEIEQILNHQNFENKKFPLRKEEIKYPGLEIRIANILYEKGFKTRKGDYIHTTTLRRIITNAKYKGFFCTNTVKYLDYKTHKQIRLPKSEWNVYDSEGVIPAIVSPELWDKANEILEKKSSSYCAKIKDMGTFQRTTTYGGLLF